MTSLTRISFDMAEVRILIASGSAQVDASGGRVRSNSCPNANGAGHAVHDAVYT